MVAITAVLCDCDPADNSITLSKRLFLHIKNNARKSDAARVFVSIFLETIHSDS